MWELIQDLWAFVRSHKKYWLIPLLVILLLLGTLLVLGPGSAVAPFVYTLF